MTTAYSYIRFSTPAQLKGDSLRRQLARSERFATEHGLTLDTSHRDLGLSAYKGTNRHKGALASFLRKIESGEIARGSHLIVENLDRLTREDVLSAVTLFLRIIEAGIIVATLNDDMIYSTQTIIDRPNDLTVSISAFIKGNREQKDKAERLQEVWGHKRSEIEAGGRRKPTRQGPGWFKLVPDDPAEPLVGEWVFTDKAATGRLVFQWCIDGLGKETISRKLNELGHPSFKHGDGWQASTVGLLLSDRRAIGELQLFTKVGGEGRRPIGDPIKGYFATANGETLVSEETFYLAQAAIAKRHCGAGVGRRGKVPNFFVGLAKCACGRTMEYRDKRGRNSPGLRHEYLICSGAQRNHSCSNKHHFTYSETEALVLDWVTDIKVSDEDANRAGVAGLTLTGKIAERDDLKRRVAEALAKWENSTIDMIKDSLMKSAERNAKALETVEAEIEKLQHTVSTTKRSVLDDRRSTVRNARIELTTLDGEALFEARAKLAAALRQVIDHIEFEESGNFTAFLHGSKKAYRFAGGKFSHAIDLEGASSWVRFPSAAEKRAVGWYEEV